MTKFEKWQPVHPIPSDLLLEAIYDDYEGFRILSRSETGKALGVLRILFDPALAYRATEEGSMVLYEREDSIDLNRFGLFIVRDSDYLEWFAKTSQGINGPVVHYAIYLSNQCVDVISSFPPQVEWL